MPTHLVEQGAIRRLLVAHQVGLYIRLRDDFAGAPEIGMGGWVAQLADPMIDLIPAIPCVPRRVALQEGGQRCSKDPLAVASAFSKTRISS